MNYLDFLTWKHPQINEICDQVFAEGFNAKFSRGPSFHKGQNWEESFQWEFSLEYPASVEFAVSSRSILLNLLQGENKERRDEITSCFWYNLSANRVAKPYRGTVGFDMKILARGLYWMGVPMDVLSSFNGTSYHDAIEWEAARLRSWEKLWELRPDTLHME